MVVRTDRVDTRWRPSDTAMAGPTIVAVGIGGRIELSRNEIRIIKDGAWGYLVETLWLGYGILDKRVFLDQIAAVEIMQMMVLPSFIRFTYQGSPPLTGHYVEDALAENALIMHPFDQRKFYELKDRIDQFIVARA
jgi:hypothetical protein